MSARQRAISLLELHKISKISGRLQLYNLSKYRTLTTHFRYRVRSYTLYCLLIGSSFEWESCRRGSLFSTHVQQEVAPLRRLRVTLPIRAGELVAKSVLVWQHPIILHRGHSAGSLPPPRSHQSQAEKNPHTHKCAPFMATPLGRGVLVCPSFSIVAAASDGR